MGTAVAKMARSMPAKTEIDTSSYSGRMAARLRQLREAKGWTVAELQERINTRVPKARRIAQQTVHSWDSGRRIINTDYLPALADCFGLSIGGFLPKE
jgi:transcriptional regulator with XRE-family HTH domain